jgi:hypothetical protein
MLARSIEVKNVLHHHLTRVCPASARAPFAIVRVAPTPVVIPTSLKNESRPSRLVIYAPAATAPANASSHHNHLPEYRFPRLATAGQIRYFTAATTRITHFNTAAALGCDPWAIFT